MGEVIRTLMGVEEREGDKVALPRAVAKKFMLGASVLGVLVANYAIPYFVPMLQMPNRAGLRMTLFMSLILYAYFRKENKYMGMLERSAVDHDDDWLIFDTEKEEKR